MSSEERKWFILNAIEYDMISGMELKKDAFADPPRARWKGSLLRPGTFARPDNLLNLIPTFGFARMFDTSCPFWLIKVKFISVQAIYNCDRPRASSSFPGKSVFHPRPRGLIIIPGAVFKSAAGVYCSGCSGRDLCVSFHFRGFVPEILACTFRIN